MAAWDPSRYLQFERERTQPCRDLVARIEGAGFREIVDLGCGPGTSTAVLRARWPDAGVTGVDRSREMLEVARRSDPNVRWTEGDIATWTWDREFDLVFSNAALHWVPGHAQLFPRLFGRLNAGGVLACQMPANSDAPYQSAAARVQDRREWRAFPAPPLAGTETGSPEFYYDLLAPSARRIDVWDTRYLHVLDGPGAVVDWTVGTGMRPWLAVLPDDAHRARFLAAYRTEIERAYPPQPDGKVLFPFLRRFLIAYR
jgi:trans-aconitate 2-methyltransferase